MQRARPIVQNPPTMNEAPDPDVFSVPIRPRYGEVDRMGVVYHAQYLVYFDVGRTAFMRAAGLPYAELEERGSLLAVVSAHVDYRRPARYDEDLRLEVALDELRRASVGFSYALVRHGPAGREVLATGSTRLGCLDRTMRPARLPPDAHEILAEGRRTPPPPSETP